MKFKWELPVKLTACLTLGGFAAILIMCFFIGFGFDSTVGKEALYVFLFLESINVLTIFLCGRRLRKRADVPAEATKMRRFRRIAAGLWLFGAAAMLFSLVLVLLGRRYGDLLVLLPCHGGLLLTWLTWPAILMSYHRRLLAAQCAARPL